jgi:hypothetical protein
MKYFSSILFLLSLIHILSSCEAPPKEVKKHPNILIAIADDQSYPHAGIYGFAETQTPGFDYVAKNGVLFHNAFVAAPQCSPSRAAMLTGKNIWELEEAGTHASNFPKKFKVFTEVLEQQGYFTGYTGKPWGPGNWQISGRKQNPVGKAYNRHQLAKKRKGVPLSFGMVPTSHIASMNTKVGLKLEKTSKRFSYQNFYPIPRWCAMMYWIIYWK